MTSLFEKSRRSLAYFVAIFIVQSWSFASSFECCSREHNRTSIRHIEGGGIGYNHGYTTLEGFFAPNPEQMDLIPFLDVRGHIFDNGEWAANTGLGLRRVVDNRIYGLNIYYDYRETKRSNFNQIGLGAESLGTCWDFRLNGYLPVGRKVDSPFGSDFGGFSGHYLLLRQKCHFAMKGVDAEAGYHLGHFRYFDLYAAAGPYYYTGKKGRDAWGGKGRLAAIFKRLLTLELSDSYDRLFHNNFQGQVTLTLPFGNRSRIQHDDECYCSISDALLCRMIQPVGREEIIVIGSQKQNSVAIDPLTGEPFFFVFVDNTSSSNGTYESPYPTLALAQANSGPYDIIYVFPGDGTTTGMDAGISLQAYQKFWGSGVSHLLQTTQGLVSIPALSSSLPTITNTNIDTDGNAITLATHNAISGFIITSALNDAIYGSDPQSLDVSYCTIENNTTYAIEASFSGAASVSLTNNTLVDNVNGIFLSLNGTSTVACSDNTFAGQTSVSSVPLEIAAANNIFTAYIENNVFVGNTTGSIRFGLDSVLEATIDVRNNTIANNGSGSQSSLGSSFVIVPTGTTQNCSIALTDNMFSGNATNSLYLHTSGAFTNLTVTASSNTMAMNGGSALVLATPVNDILTLYATDNIIRECDDNGISVIASGSTTTGTITLNNNTITDIGNASNGIAVNQDFSNLDLTILNNVIDRCEGTGVLSYAPTGIDSFTLDISGNTINNCQNLSTNAASGIDIEQYTNLEGTITNNTLSGNTGTAVVIGSTLPAPTACLTLTGNDSSTGYLLSNPVDGTFRLSPCDVDTANVGTINTSGTIDQVQSCSNPTPCPP